MNMGVQISFEKISLISLYLGKYLELEFLNHMVVLWASQAALVVKNLSANEGDKREAGSIGLNDLDNCNSVFTHLEPSILECEVK